jgi:uncharacterized protein (DUF2126 family)
MSKGRPPGTGSANTKMMRVIITPRQERLFAQIRKEVGGSESEHVRRALDDYLDKLIARGEIVDNGPASTANVTKLEDQRPV